MLFSVLLIAFSVLILQRFMNRRQRREMKRELRKNKKAEGENE